LLQEPEVKRVLSAMHAWASRGHDVGCGVNSLPSGKGIPQNTVVMLDTKFMVCNLFKRLCQKFPGLDLIEELKQNRPKKYLFGRLFSLVRNIPNEILTYSIGCSVGIGKFENG